MQNGQQLVVRSFLGSLPKKINSQEKIDALTYFAQGAALCGDNACATNSQVYESCDVGAIIGNAFDANPSKTLLPHYKVRKMVMDTQTQLGKYWLSIDSNVFIYKDYIVEDGFRSTMAQINLDREYNDLVKYSPIKIYDIMDTEEEM